MTVGRDPNIDLAAVSPLSDHAALQAAVDALCQQLADYQPAVELAKQKPEPR